MTKMNKLYRILSIGSFVLHICIFVFVIIVGFLPYREQDNFYQFFVGYFGKTLSAIQPYLVMAILLLSCIVAFFAIKRPLFSFFVLVCSIAFFVIAIFPYSVESIIVGITSPWTGGSMSTYGIGCDLICAVSHVVYVDKIFFIFSVITLFINSKRNS